MTRLADFLVRDQPGGTGFRNASCATSPTRNFPSGAQSSHTRWGAAIERGSSGPREPV